MAGAEIKFHKSEEDAQKAASSRHIVGWPAADDLVSVLFGASNESCAMLLTDGDCFHYNVPFRDAAIAAGGMNSVMSLGQSPALQASDLTARALDQSKKHVVPGALVYGDKNSKKEVMKGCVASVFVDAPGESVVIVRWQVMYCATPCMHASVLMCLQMICDEAT